MKSMTVTLPKTANSRNILATAPLLKKSGKHTKDTKQGRKKAQRVMAKKLTNCY